MDGSVEKLKARLVAMGNTQTHGTDYDETYSPTADRATLRVFLLYCLQNDLEIFQLDVETAFLQVAVDKDIYMHLPDGYDKEGNKGKVLKLNKAIYGLKQSSRLFNLKFKNCLVKNGWNSILSDKCLFARNGQLAINHVDDALFGVKNKTEYSKILEEFK